MIKNLKLRVPVDSRGKITSGEKAVNSSGVEYPKSLEYFNIQPFQELINSYGEKPDRLVVIFPTDRIEDFYDSNYVLYNSGQHLVRKCDGEECLHRLKEKMGDSEFEAGEMSECICKQLSQTIMDPKNKKEKRNPQLCNYLCYFKAYIVDIKMKRVNNPMPYMFQTGSENSGNNIYSALSRLQSLNMGVIKNVPFLLWVKMIEGREQKRKFPVWNLQPMGMLNDIRQLSGTSNENILSMIPENLDAPELEIAEKPSENIDVPDGEIDFSVYEKPDYWIKEMEKCKTAKELYKLAADNKAVIKSFGKDDLKKIEDKYTSLYNTLP